MHFFLTLTKEPPLYWVFLLGPQSFLLVDLAHIAGLSYPPTEPEPVASVASTFSTSLSFNFGVSLKLFLTKSLSLNAIGPENEPEDPEPVASLVSFLFIRLNLSFFMNGSSLETFGVPKV